MEPLSSPANTEATETAEEVIQVNPIVHTFGDHPKTRFLTVLAGCYPRSLNPSTLADSAALSRKAWYDHRADLLESSLIEQTGNAGNSTMYALVDGTRDKRIEWLTQLYDRTSAHLRENTDQNHPSEQPI